MSKVDVQCVHLRGSGHLIVADKQRGNLQISRPAAKTPVIDLRSVFDIIELRDLLNDVYPVEVYSNNREMRRLPKGS